MSVFQDRRNVIYYNISCESVRNRADHLFALTDIIKYYQEGLLPGKCARAYKNKDLVISIKDIKVDDDIVCLLLCSTDKRKSDPTFENTTYGRLRTEKKQPGEGLSSTVHVLIDMKPSMGVRNHNCLVEEVNGFGKTVFARFLNGVARALVPGQSIPDVEKGKDVVVKPNLIFNVMQDSIENDIKSGKGAIKNIVFETLAEKGDGADSNKWVQSVSRREVYKIDSNGSKQLQWAKSFIKSKMEEHAGKYRHAKIIYTTSDNITKTTELQKSKDDAVSFAFGKVDEIILNIPISDSALSSIDQGLYGIMKRKLLAVRK